MLTNSELNPPSFPRLNQLTEWAHLGYLGLLPALATFAVLVRFGHRWPFVIFIGGTVAVSVYLAATISYTRMPAQLPVALFMLIDGPLVVWLAQRGEIDPLGFLIEGYLVDGTAVWLGILFLALRSPLPTTEQRWASVGFMLAAILTTSSLFWPYIEGELWGNWARLGPLLLGLVEGTVLQFGLAREDEVQRSAAAPVYIGVLLILWVGLMFAGNIGFELGWMGGG